MEKLVVVFLLIFSSTISLADVNLENVRNKLSSYLETDDIPDVVIKVVAGFVDMVDILKCVPNIKNEDCYQSSPCRIPHLQHDVEISMVLYVCKKPWRMMLDLVEFKVAGVEVDSVYFIIDFDDILTSHGYLPIYFDFSPPLKTKVPDTNLRMIMEGVIRFDCGLPRGDENWKRRSRINIYSPGEYNALFHSLKIRVEVQKNSKCVLCDEIFNRKGIFGYGPQSCVSEAQRYKQIKSGA